MTATSSGRRVGAGDGGIEGVRPEGPATVPDRADHRLGAISLCCSAIASSRFIGRCRDSLTPCGVGEAHRMARLWRLAAAVLLAAVGLVAIGGVPAYAGNSDDDLTINPLRILLS